MSKLAKALTAAAGNAGGESLYVEDVFSTYLYEGAGSTQTITNGIDLDGEGGLVWIKNRDGATNHRLYTTDLYSASNSNLLQTNLTTAGGNTGSFELESFNSNGFTLGYSGGAYSESNGANTDYVSWTFRKAEKFFDVVTFTGDGNSSNLISHNLGSTPAFMIMKRTDSNSGWMTAASDGAGNYKAAWNLNSTAQSYVTTPISTVSTDSTVDVGYWNPNWDGAANLSGATYVLYLFASDAGGFGDDGSENIIKCGSFSYSGSEVDINLGFEPQFFLYKASNVSNDWEIVDVMRGWDETQNCRLKPHENSGEACYSISSTNFIKPYANGVKFKTGGSGRDYIYIAIRRPMKTPESGTEVFNADYQGNGTTNPAYVSGFVTDFGIRYFTPGGASAYPITGSRLTGTNRLTTSSTAAQVSQSSLTWDYMNGWYNPDSASSLVFSHMFKRATGFFDVVAYTGTGSAQTLSHNLGVAPELIIEKRRDGVSAWLIYNEASGNTKYMQFSSSAEATSAAAWNNTSPTISEFTVGTGASVSGGTHIAYLFATLAGVSKVGSYTGNGTSQTIDCGFSGGARFILIKRTDSTGDWYVWDSERGIVAGNDPHLSLNTTAAEVTTDDSIDPDSSGFIVNQVAATNINVSSASYIYLSIA